MHDRTAEIADRLRTDPRIVALVLGAPWRRAAGDGAGADAGGAGAGDTNGAGAGAGADDIDGAGAGPRTGPQTTAASGDRADGRGRMYVGVPSPAELTELDLPVDGLRHFGLSPADLRAGGWTDTDLRSAGLTPPGAEPEPVEWFLAGEPAQLMLAIVPPGPPLLARPEPGSGAGGFDPADVQEIPGIDGCTDPESDGMLLVREIRDGLVRRARRRLVHCVVCLRQVHRTDPATGVCPGCAAQWLGVLP